MPSGRDREEVDAEAFRIAERCPGLEPARGAEGPDGAGPGDRRARPGRPAGVVGPPGRGAPPARRPDAGRAARRQGGRPRRGRSGWPIRRPRSDTRRGPACSRPSKFAEADRMALAGRRLAQGPSRTPRPRAGMLRALARGRALATREPGASRASYLEALEARSATSPTSRPPARPDGSSARSGSASGRPTRRLALWSRRSSHGHPRWLEARGRSIADRLREAVEVQRINRDAAAIGLEDGRRPEVAPDGASTGAPGGRSRSP